MFLVSIVSVLFIKIKVSKRNTFNEPSESIFSLKVLNLFSKSWITVPKNDFRASKTLSSEKAVDNPWLHLQFWLWNQKYFFFKIFPQKFWISKKGGIPPLKGKKKHWTSSMYKTYFFFSNIYSFFFFVFFSSNQIKLIFLLIHQI